MSTAKLAALIDSRLAVLTQLLALSRQQARVIDAEDLSALLTVLAGKQQLVNQLQLLDRQLAPYQQQAPESRQWASTAERTRCQQQAAKCEAALLEIISAEQQAEHQMTQRRDAVAQRLAAINQTSHAARGYLPAVPSAVSQFTSEG
jgi:hypothetical protein